MSPISEYSLLHHSFHADKFTGMNRHYFLKIVRQALAVFFKYNRVANSTTLHFLFYLTTSICFYQDIIAQTGKVGINITTPSGMLHVDSGSVVFTSPLLLPSMASNPPVSGAGSRLMWYPDRAAFRVGGVSSTQWNKDSIGSNSVAMGYNTTARSPYAFAMGNNTRASGLSSTAMGFNSIASGFTSTAIGRNTIASGPHAFSSGDSTIASGLRSTAMGGWTRASGEHSIALGYYSISSADQSVAIGNYTEASGTNAFATGNHTDALGPNSTAMGDINVASGYASTAMGIHNISSGAGAMAMGGDALASGEYSIAGGYGCSSTLDFAMAFGYLTSAQGAASVALGTGTKGIGIASTALGHYSNAVGYYSLSSGYSTTAKSFGSFVLGRFNDTTSISGNNWNDLDPLFIIGNGSGHTMRSNAVTILKNGNAGIGPDYSPNYRLHVTSNEGGNDSWPEGIMIENFSSSAGESALSFRNSTIPSTRQWNIGLNQGPGLSFNYGFQFAGGSTWLFIDTLGNVGIGKVNPAYLLDIDGKAKAADLIVDNEVQRVATGTANLAPICYGSVSSGGTILSGTGNFSVTNVSTGQYEITITGESYTTSGYATTVTLLGVAARSSSIQSNLGKLVIYTFDANGNDLNIPFQFVVFKP